MKQIRKIPRLHWAALILTIILVLIFNAVRQIYRLPDNLKNPGDSGDWLAYSIASGDKDVLMLYDPYRHISVPVRADTGGISFVFSRNRNLAYSLQSDGNQHIYVMDTISAISSPINIQSDKATRLYLLSWSPDGRYLAFSGDLDGLHSLLIWDGKAVFDVTPAKLPDTARGYQLAWSSDGRLAFTVGFTYVSPYKGDPSEIYLWNGQTTIDLSQNPTGEDSEPTWSADNRLAFLSDRNAKYGIFLWDGRSTKNGSPNADTFTNVAPQLTWYYSYPEWTNKGLLAFVANVPQSPSAYPQIYLWDGQAGTNMSQISGIDVSSPRWSADGNWAFSTYYAPGASLYVRNIQNRTTLTVKGGSSPAWSSNGYLTFCAMGSLSIWDGKQIATIAQGGEIWAQWQSGASTVCTSG